MKNETVAAVTLPEGTHGYNRPSDRNGCAYYEER